MTRHVYRCPLRWADMDLLGHVNNVTYVDYLQEARVDMLRVHPPTSGGEALAEGVVVVRHEVQYRAPLSYREEPVTIEVWVSEIRAARFTLGYEIVEDGPDGRVVHLRARTVLTPYVFAGEHPRRVTPAETAVLERFLEPDPTPLPPVVRVGDPPQEARHTYWCPVRFSDVDAYRHVNNVKYFEYFQEARIAHMGALSRSAESAPVPTMVVAQADVDYRTPMFFRPDPYPVQTWAAEVGRTSFVIEGVVLDRDPADPDAGVLSRSRMVMVCVDPRTGRPTPLTVEQREVLTRSARRR